MRLKFSELYSALSDAKIDLADAQIEMFEMKQKIAELQAKLNASDECDFPMLYIGTARQLKIRQIGPFCPICYEGPEKELASMSSVSGHFKVFGKYKYNICAAYVK